MYSVTKGVGIGKTEFNQADTTAASLDPNPTDPWMFTDPMAYKFYQQHEQHEVLEDDISKYVMFDGRWMSEELEYKLEIRRLLREGLISAGSSYGYLSPHPTIYHTLRAGNFTISGRRYAFRSGEEL